MGFIKKDVNFGLMLLIIASLLLFTGFSVYYQTNFKEVVSEYNTKLEELQKVTRELTKEKSKLNQTYELRVKAEKDISALDAQYRELSDERDQLDSDKRKLQTELSSTKTELSEAKVQLSQTKDTLAQTQAELSITNSRLRSCDDKLDDLCDKYPDESEC